MAEEQVLTQRAAAAAKALVSDEKKPAPVADDKSTVAEEDTDLLEEKDATPSFKWSEVVWYNVFVLALWHVGAVYALVNVIPYASWRELGVQWILFWWFSGLGITAGAHRLWSHKAYKAKLPLRVFLMLCNSMAFQGSIFEWSRDHRVHHKGSDTTADPHNSQRGFFFAHMGWVMVRKHQNVRLAGKKINFADLLEDPVVRFQKNYYISTVLLMCYAVPTLVGYWMGNAWTGFIVGGVFRHVWVLHMTWCVNSVAHFFGYKPYDRNIRAVENLIVSIGAIGEGYHNYHHKYPSDYATSEWGITSGHWNPTKLFIDICAAVGLASDLKRSRTAAATRERLAIKVHEEMLKNGLTQQFSFFDRVIGRFFFGRSEEQLF
uniref:Fatty acid desaturase domain-containing protein n=1 Tax=Globisporangium ultimum (strain ATCC 200006 / CBS 805.95 / DAOM BR144) TaxID=431595 RepID=K3X369_GLOUD